METNKLKIKEDMAKVKEEVMLHVQKEIE